MKQNKKELLLKDLCARLPYGVKVNEDIQGDFTLIGLSKERVFTTCEVEGYFNDFPIELIKPYLFPLSSMTEEQNDSWRDAWFPDLLTSTDVNYPESEKYLAVSHAKSLDWLYKNHIDIYGFIEKGLAIDATGLNIY